MKIEELLKQIRETGGTLQIKPDEKRGNLEISLRKRNTEASFLLTYEMLDMVTPEVKEELYKEMFKEMFENSGI